MLPLAPIVVQIVTGPTGIGKTRLINGWLDQFPGENVFTFANEPGHTQNRQSLPAIATPSAAACHCCQQGRFTAFLEQVARAIDNGRHPNFDRLIFETSGVGDPIVLARELVNNPYLSKRFVLGPIIMPLFQIPMHISNSVAMQITSCDALILSPHVNLESWKSILVSRNPNAKVLPSSLSGHLVAKVGFNISRRSAECRKRFYSIRSHRMARDL